MSTKQKRPKRKRPEHGWHLVEVCDANLDPFAGEVYCERCSQELRYCHVLWHREWPEEIIVGRCCSKRLSADYDADGLEQHITNRSKRRERFPDLEGWRISHNGNPWIEYHRTTITIFPREIGGFAYCVNRDGENYFSPQEFPTVRHAKLAAWDKWAELLEQ